MERKKPKLTRADEERFLEQKRKTDAKIDRVRRGLGENTRETDKFIFFWMGDSVYSNFNFSPFKHQGIQFMWSEQAVMYRKAMLFGATKVAQEILEADTPSYCKLLGRSNEIPFKEDVWQKNRKRIYKEVLMDKFSVPFLKKCILSTGHKMLVEASPSDRIWGIGMHKDHPDVEDPKKWKGMNLLGQVLMEVREELRKQEETA
ncbi:NADAR family protein [Bacillus phage Kirov]|uniref:NADAR family protein n=1 Tax=Bacillus phage Kirov TaxID=2783539 RepID=A0A7U3RX23_9CAUD|nr:NADAR family protein [Bacillus phage Kirov]QOV08333.1 NADAR family protein [Bacillus phage Kirov]